MAKKDKDTESDLISRVKDFMSENKTVFSLNKDDIKVSRRIASGLGFGEKERKIWGDDRAEVTVNVLRPVINKLVSSYDANPFQLDIKSRSNQDITAARELFQAVQNDNDFNVLISNAIRETADDGLSYLLAYHETNAGGVDIKIKRLNNQSVFFPDDCKKANGSDAKMVVHADVIDKADAKEMYDLQDYEISSNDLLQGYDIIDSTRKQCGLVTVYEKVADGVKVSKIIHSKVVDETLLPIKNIPVVRFYGEKVTLENKDNWRGIYHSVSNLLTDINFAASRQLESVAMAPSVAFILAEESLKSKDTQWANINGAPRAYATYKSVDDSGRELPKPERQNTNIDVSGYTALIASIQNLINTIIGDTASNEIAGTPTAEQILYMQSNSDASISGYIRNAKDSAVQLGELLLQFIAMAFEGIMIEGLQVDAVNGPIAASVKDKNLRKLIAFSSMVASNPEVQKMAPVIIENLDIDAQAKRFLMQQYAPQTQAQIPPQVQQQMIAKDQQLAAQQKMLDDMKNQTAQLQMALFEYQKDSKASLIKAQMEIESKEKIEMWKLQAAAGKLAVDTETKKEMQSQQLIADYITELNKYKQPEVLPTFNAGRFV